MTMQEKRRQDKVFGEVVHAGTTVFLLCFVMLGVTLNIVWIIVGAVALALSVAVSHAYYIGGTAMLNPLKVLIEVKEKQEALFKYLKLKASLVPRHWKVTKL